MHNDRLLDRVEKELDAIADKGLTTSNIDLAFKLIDIYKDIKESKYYDCEAENYNGKYWDGRYNGSWEARGNSDGRYDRYITRMKEGIEQYNNGRNRYRNGDSQERMIDGIDMTMSAICMFVESLADFAETSKEKEVIRKHVEKMKNI